MAKVCHGSIACIATGTGEADAPESQRERESQSTRSRVKNATNLQQNCLPARVFPAGTCANQAVLPATAFSSSRQCSSRSPAFGVDLLRKGGLLAVDAMPRRQWFQVLPPNHERHRDKQQSAPTRPPRRSASVGTALPSGIGLLYPVTHQLNIGSHKGIKAV